MIDPLLRPIGANTTWHRTGLQTDSSSCGFWCLLFLFGPVFDLDIKDPRVSRLQVSHLKTLFQEVWMSYVTDPLGLRTDVVQKWLAPLGAAAAWQDLGDVVSQ